MPLTIRTVLRDALLVYLLTFVFGLGSAVAGMHLSTNASLAYLTNVLAGGLGFTIAGVRVSSHRIEHLIWVAAVFWSFNLLNIALGLQTTAAWIHSSLTVLFMSAVGAGLATVLTAWSRTRR